MREKKNKKHRLTSISNNLTHNITRVKINIYTRYCKIIPLCVSASICVFMRDKTH